MPRTPRAALPAITGRFSRAMSLCRADPAGFARRLRWELSDRAGRAYDESKWSVLSRLPTTVSALLRLPGRDPEPARLSLRMRTLNGIIDEPTDIVLVVARDATRIANEIAQARPDATVHLLAVHPISCQRQAQLRPNVAYRHCVTVADRVDYLSKQPQPQLIIERGNNLRRQKVGCFRELFPLIAPGGAYVVESLLDVHPAEANRASGWTIFELLKRIDGLRQGDPRDGAGTRVLELADSLSDLEFHDNAAIAHKGIAHQFSLRDSTANTVLEARFGTKWGEVLETRPATCYRSNAHLFIHGDGPITETLVVKVPERYLRRYESAQCWPLQRVRFCDYWLPDTFRHPMNKILTHRRLIRASADTARLTQGSGVPAPTRSANGPFFYFDTEYPGHFGHVMTEIVSRYWGWLKTREIAPDARPLVSLSRGQESIPPFQQVIFAALEIDTDSIEYIQWNECVEVDNLYAVSPDFVMPQYVDQGLAAVWDRIRRYCEQPDLPPSPERLFVSRRPRKIRTCLNTTDVEAMFVRHGFGVVYPEEHDFAAQVTMFHRAKMIAGFGGSGMFNAMFAPDATLIVISGEGYTANNEYMIKSVIGGDVHYVWGDSLIKQPTNSWTWAAYQSNFILDIERFEPELARIVECDTDS